VEFSDGVSGAAITKRNNRISREIAEDKKLRGVVNGIKKEILKI
jgi:hypothetical protein